MFKFPNNTCGCDLGNFAVLTTGLTTGNSVGFTPGWVAGN